MLIANLSEIFVMKLDTFHWTNQLAVFVPNRYSMVWCVDTLIGMVIQCTEGIERSCNCTGTAQSQSKSIGIICLTSYKSMSRRLLRSVLFCPADKDKVLLKSVNLVADAIVYDLEDAVSPQKKVVARELVSSFLSKQKTTRTRVVRVNCPLSTSWGRDDLRVISSLSIDALILPKVESGDSVELANEIIRQYRGSNIPIWTMIETAKGVLNAPMIAQHSSVECLVFGSNDLTKDLRAKQTPTREPLLFSMCQCILAARAAGKRVLDGVHVEFSDLSGLEQSCHQGRALGFDGKTLIHPSQIDAANAAYSPSNAEVDHARRVVEGWRQAEEAGLGVAVVDGKMVEALHAQEAQLVLEIVDEIQRCSNI